MIHWSYKQSAKGERRLRKLKAALKHGSSDRVPTFPAQSLEFKPQTLKK
jgi:hypothetical protein